MKLKLIILSVILFFIAKVSAQQEYQHSGIYTIIGYELGFLSSDIQETTIPFTNNSINGNFNHSLALTGIYKTPFNAEIKLGYIASYNSLTVEGLNVDKPFSVDNNYYSHTVLIGAGYNFEVTNVLDITIGLGSAISFIENKNITEIQGDTSDQLVATNNSLKKGNVYLVPELSITKYFKNGNTLTLGGKYYHSANDNFLQSSIENRSNNNVLKRVNYTTKNNRIAVYVSYGFNLSTLF